MRNLPETLEEVYFIGIGGIGMSALARYFRQRGCSVSGYDRTPSPLTRQLEAEGISVHYEEDLSAVPERVELCVYTPAVPQTHAEYCALRERNVCCMKRAEVLGAISREKYTVALAGTHGKTSMTSLSALLLRGDQPLTAFIGGIANNFQSNLLNDENSRCMVVEADEFDRSFLQLTPDIAVVSSVDADHLDIYHTEDALRQAFDLFSQQIKAGGCLITKPELRKYFHTPAKVYTYSMEVVSADFRVENLRIADGSSCFDVCTPEGRIPDLLLPTAGLYNVENALAAVAVAFVMKMKNEKIKAQLLQYKGVKRRFEYIVRREGCVYIDDYAHHPNELKACIASARAWYPDRKICGIFQPHLYTRTRDFADEFAAVLSTLDVAVLLDIYPARELPIEGVDARMLLDRMTLDEKYLSTKEDLVPLLKKLKPEVMLTMGAGDIDRIVDTIKNAFA